MRSVVLGLPVACLLSALAVSSAGAVDFTVGFAYPGWNGKRIPEGQHCAKFGGKGSTPPLIVSGIPAKANAIVVEFNDRSYQPLSFDGGHGKVGFQIAEDSTEATLMAVPGGTAALPEGTWLVAKNRASGDWTSEGYLPPCSGGRGNKYFAKVLAVIIDPASKTIQKTLAKTKITLGKY